ncbi:MAG: nuclear transport factor 2 family protein [Hyphococcus sp.]
MRLCVAIIIFIAFLNNCAPDAERANEVAPSGGVVEVVNNLMSAFNDHDPERMRAYWHSDVVWIEVAGDQSSVVTTSAAQLHSELIDYFEAFPSVSSSLENITVNGNYITAIERPVWEEDGERRSHASVVVYEITAGKVKRFWYFPPQ